MGSWMRSIFGCILGLFLRIIGLRLLLKENDQTIGKALIIAEKFVTATVKLLGFPQLVEEAPVVLQGQVEILVAIYLTQMEENVGYCEAYTQTSSVSYCY